MTMRKEGDAWRIVQDDSYGNARGVFLRNRGAKKNEDAEKVMLSLAAGATTMRMPSEYAREKLRGQTTIVTGASRGLGRAYATALADADANVVCVARTAADLRRQWTRLSHPSGRPSRAQPT